VGDEIFAEPKGAPLHEVSRFIDINSLQWLKRKFSCEFQGCPLLEKEILAVDPYIKNNTRKDIRI
jgi:hypothetical protein